ncbi:hypothetical protein B0H14DRAFT_2988861, partial [Mycena olivaceomarginata]
AESAPLRISVLGIGDAVSTAMCEGIARVEHGCACSSASKRRASREDRALLKASKTPVSNISVDWGRPPPRRSVPESEMISRWFEEAAGTQGEDSQRFDE